MLPLREHLRFHGLLYFNGKFFEFRTTFLSLALGYEHSLKFWFVISRPPDANFRCSNYDERKHYRLCDFNERHRYGCCTEWRDLTSTTIALHAQFHPMHRWRLFMAFGRTLSLRSIRF
jgi:hypothetical protein